MAKKTELKERGTGEVLYPMTRPECVLLDDDTTLKDWIGHEIVAPYPLDNELVYTSSDGNLVEFGDNCDTTHILSNNYFRDKGFGKVVFDSELTAIPDNLFYARNTLNGIKLREGITEIGEGAFYNTSLVEVRLPDSCILVKQNAFRMIPSLMFVEHSNAVFEGEGGFKWNAKLRDFKFSPSQEEVPVQMFYGANNVHSVLLNGCKRLALGAFYAAYNINYISELNNVVYFGTSCLYGVKVKEISIHKDAVIEAGAFSTTSFRKIQTAKTDISNFPPANELEFLVLTANSVVKDVDTYISTFEVENPKIIVPTTLNEGFPTNEPAPSPMVALDTYIGTPNNWLKIYVPQSLLKEYQETYPTLKNHFHPITGEDIYALKDETEKAIDIVSASGEELNAEIGKYYLFEQEANTLAITLPTMPKGSGQQVKALEIFFTTGDSPFITISASEDVDYFSGFLIEPRTTYELNIMYNGQKWIVAYGVVE